MLEDNEIVTNMIKSLLIQDFHLKKDIIRWSKELILVGLNSLDYQFPFYLVLKIDGTLHVVNENNLFGIILAKFSYKSNCPYPSQFFFMFDFQQAVKFKEILRKEYSYMSI